MTGYDPGLVDYITEREIVYHILDYLNEQSTIKTEGWVKVPEIVEQLRKNPQSLSYKNLSSTVHNYCKNLQHKFKAIDRHESQRPTYYRINEKGKRHLEKAEKRLGVSAKKYKQLAKTKREVT